MEDERLDAALDRCGDAFNSALLMVERLSPIPHQRPRTDAERLENTIAGAANTQAAATLAAAALRLVEG